MKKFEALVPPPFHNKNLMKQVLLAIAVIAAATANADLGQTNSEIVKREGAQAYSHKQWKSPSLNVGAFHEKDGSTSVYGFSGGKAVVQIVYLSDDLLAKFPADQQWEAALAVYSGDLDWVEMDGSTPEHQLYQRDGEMAFVLHDAMAIVLLDDDWSSAISQSKLTEFITEATAWK